MSEIHPALEDLSKRGQSIWLDNLSRDLLNSGELQQLINLGVHGVTSNPTIFKQAIADSSTYDDDLKKLPVDLSVEEIAESLMIEDVGRAADLFLPVYNNSQGTDGYVSIEVSPTLAHDTEGTLKAARRIFQKLERPNVMVKVPGTKAGIPAIQTLLEEGIPVNITLLFSPERYREVVEVYLIALENRLQKNQDISRVFSVASFFVSRMDSLLEKEFSALQEAGKITQEDQKNFLGKAGTANAKIAYRLFEEVFQSDRFLRLKEKKACVQKPLWASTSTKNPALPPLLYVKELVLKDTINTVPPKTLNEVLESQTVEEARSEVTGTDFLETVWGYGIDSGTIFEKLEEEGIQKFVDSYNDLLEAIRGQRISP